jgi:phosphate transport system substrate-binding protein
MLKQLFLTILLCFALSGCAEQPAAIAVSPSPTPRAGRVAFAGSTTVQPLIEKIAAVYRSRNTQVELEIAAGGSVVGINAVQDGSADIGMVSRELKPDEVKGPIERYQIAIDVLAIIVHPGNPVQRLTRAQLKGIYAGIITNWRELGGPDLPIIPVMRATSSGTRGAFDDLVLGKDAPAPAAETQVTAGEVAARVASTPAAIGYVGFGNLGSGATLVAVEGVLPSPATAQDGSYSLTRPLLLLTGPLSRPLAKDFIAFVLSDEGQQLVVADGWVPVQTTGKK